MTMTPMTNLELVKATLHNLGRVRLKECLEPLMPYVGDELKAVYDPAKRVVARGMTHDWTNCTSNFLIRDEEIAAQAAVLADRVMERRQRSVAGLLLKIAFDFHKRHLERPRLVTLEGEWLKQLAVTVHHGSDCGVMVYTDCSYAVEETP